MRVYFMRHAETALNRQRVLQGRLDEPLNESGREQARQAGAGAEALGLSFDSVVASPLRRAVESACIVSGVPEEAVELDERLLELDYGPYERMKYEALDGSMFAWFRDPESAPAPAGVESVPHLEERVLAFLRDLSVREEESILVVTHGVTIRAVLKHLEHLTSAESWEKRIGNCDLYEAECRRGAWGLPSRIFSL